MSNQTPQIKITEDAIDIHWPQQKPNLVARLLSKPTAQKTENQALLCALGDLRRWTEEHPDDATTISKNSLSLSHDAAASLNTREAQALGLPPDVDLTLKTDVTGRVGQPDFRLHTEWSRHGQQERPKRVGCILYTAEGSRRLPLWLKDILDYADHFDPTQPLEKHWQALARFRNALSAEEDNKNVSLTAFLKKLQVHLVDRFSLSPNHSLSQFEIVPYSGQKIDEQGIEKEDICEGNAAVTGDSLANFQERLRTRGARAAYQLDDQKTYLVIDPMGQAVLKEMIRIQGAGREERRAFIKNPYPVIRAVVTNQLEKSGALDDLDLEGEEEKINATIEPVFIESQEYSARVIGVTRYDPPPADIETSGTTWLPELFPIHTREALGKLTLPELYKFQKAYSSAKETGEETIELAGEEIKVTTAGQEYITGEINKREKETKNADEKNETRGNQDNRPIILETRDNMQDLSWVAKYNARQTLIPPILPQTIRTKLLPHQKESFQWAVEAWQAGLPGLLNADEQGLGKTLQTLAFLTWLKEQMKETSAKERGPILIVAPTSLLRNWEQEIETHIEPGKFGSLQRLYGKIEKHPNIDDSQGAETQSGQSVLNLDWLDEKIKQGRAHEFYFLTTYRTLTDYQHSLGSVRFSALVMDEIQNIKNPNSLNSKAVAAMNADFRLGLTGTPVENTASDLWVIMDRIAPGCLGHSLRDFKQRYTTPNHENMADLHARVFKPRGDKPALGLRRLKDHVAHDLPKKQLILHPRFMPSKQADSYDRAYRLGGAQLRKLHHIRSVSVHPGDLDGLSSDDDFIANSARLQCVMDILSRIQTKKQRALVFIEHRDIQFRFAEIARHRFGLEKIEIINGNTPIKRRQDIVNGFQQHLNNDKGFDLLILGPKAAGTGLTLTAATHIIHLSRWWNPAVEEQCNDRAHRIGQKYAVSVHIPMALHPEQGRESFDCKLQSLMERKRKLARQALWPDDSKEDTKALLNETDDEESSTQSEHKNESIPEIMAAQFKRDGLTQTEPDYSYGLNGAWTL